MADSAEQMAEIMNKLIADAAAAEKECEILQVNLRASLSAEFDFKRELEEAKIERDRYRLQRDFLVSLLPPDSEPFQSIAFLEFLARTLNNIEEESDADSDSDSGHPTESDSE